MGIRNSWFIKIGYFQGLINFKRIVRESAYLFETIDIALWIGSLDRHTFWSGIPRELEGMLAAFMEMVHPMVTSPIRD